MARHYNGTEQMPRERAFTVEMNIMSESRGAFLFPRANTLGCLLAAVDKPMGRGGQTDRMDTVPAQVWADSGWHPSLCWKLRCALPWALGGRVGFEPSP